MVPSSLSQFRRASVSVYLQKINDSGQIVGGFDDTQGASDPIGYPFLSTSGTFTDLTPVLDSVADLQLGCRSHRL